AKGMGKSLFVKKRDAIFCSLSAAGGGPFADAVKSQDRRLFERRGKECAGRVRFMMFREDDAFFVTAPQPGLDFAWQVQFLVQPQRHGLQERAKAARRIGKVSLQQSLELEQRLVVKTDVVELVDRQAGRFQAITDRLRRHGKVVLDAGE